MSLIGLILAPFKVSHAGLTAITINRAEMSGLRVRAEIEAGAPSVDRLADPLIVVRDIRKVIGDWSYERLSSRGATRPRGGG
jgi:hypothetical protein